MWMFEYTDWKNGEVFLVKIDNSLRKRVETF